MTTSYFSKSANNPNAISIAAKAPDWYKGKQYKKLAPKYERCIERKFLIVEKTKKDFKCNRCIHQIRSETFLNLCSKKEVPYGIFCQNDSFSGFDPIKLSLEQFPLCREIMNNLMEAKSGLKDYFDGMTYSDFEFYADDDLEDIVSDEISYM